MVWKMVWEKVLSALVISALCIVGLKAENADVASARRLAYRVLGERAESFIFGVLDSPTDKFSLENVGEKIRISGNNANSMAVGLNYYLKNYCRTTVSWYRSDPVQLPSRFPEVAQPVTVEAKVDTRFFLNYCTFGYTMAWWKWSDWERFIDWMALNGINLPLAITGQEAVWYRVWTDMGLTDEEVRSYFTGPAHLPWHEMCNLDGWQAPLPKEWLSMQADLQKQIVARERELNMKPVLSAFAGHVPAALKRIYPAAKTTQVSEWGGFADRFRCTYLNPMDSLFPVIQRKFLEEQERMYGTSHVYGIDPFNEVDPPCWDADSLGQMARHIYESVAHVDKEAVWLQMAWLFYADSEHWTAPRIKAYLQAVPQDKLLLLDYFCEYTELWKKTDSFSGQPYLWCYLGNFGGNSFLSGPVKLVSERLADALANGGTNMKGIGSTLEGFGVNQFMYEFVLDKAWNISMSDEEWFNKLADRRTGIGSDAARKAWKLLSEKVYIQPAQVGQGTLTNARPYIEGNVYWTTKPTVEYRFEDLLEAWRLLLSVENVDRDTYEFDVINIGRQVLGDYFQAVRNEFVSAYKDADTEKMRQAGNRMMEILSDLDELLSCHPTFSLHDWIQDARDKGETPPLKNYYEWNARTLITIWGDSYHLTDYANRSWAGLTGQYYAPRWKHFIDEAVKAVSLKKPFDEKTFRQWSLDFENNWVKLTNEISYKKRTDGISLSRELYRKYSEKYFR